MIGKLFGKKKKDIGNPDKGLQTLQALNTQIDTLEKKLDFLDKQGGDLTNQAKAKPKAGDKAGAKKLLTKKNRLVSQIKQLEGAQNMLEEQKAMLENSNTMKDVFSTLKSTDEFTIVGFHYDKSVNNVEVSTVLQIVDDTGANCVRRNNILNRNATHIGISACRMKDNYYCFYLVFGNKK